MTTSTLLFAQQGVKVVQLTDECITVHYVDGGEPIHINSDDKMYAFHLKQFGTLETNNLESLEEPGNVGDQQIND